MLTCLAPIFDSLDKVKRYQSFDTILLAELGQGVNSLTVSQQVCRTLFFQTATDKPLKPSQYRVYRANFADEKADVNQSLTG